MLIPLGSFVEIVRLKADQGPRSGQTQLATTMLASRGAPWFPGKGGALRTIYTPTGGYTAGSVSEFTHRLFPSPWRALEFTDAESVDTDLTGPWE